MIHDEEELYEFYDDSLDIEDEHNDESVGFEDEPIGSSDSGIRAKKKSPFGFIALLAIIGVGGYGAYAFYLKDNSPLNIPIVQLDSAFFDDGSANQDPDTENPALLNQPAPAQDIISHDISQNEDTDISVFAEDLYEGTAKVIETPAVEEVAPVITPLPALEELQDTQLVSIEETLDSPEIKDISDVIAHADLEDADINLVEEDLLLKTEDSFIDDVDKPDTSTALNKNADGIKPDAALQKEVFIEEIVAIPPPETSKASVKNEIRIITPKSKSSVPAEKIDTPQEPIAAPKKIEPQAKAKIPSQAKNQVVKPEPKQVKVGGEHQAKADKPVESQWVIKAILPGKAVVHDTVSGETRSVEIGDSINPIGRINSIKKINNKWVVIGSKGRVTQ